MNFSNLSCEYFYDEEYDVAVKEGSYNQPFINSLNNNCYKYFEDVDNAEKPPYSGLYSDFDINSSNLWSESAMRESGNNNYLESCCEKPDSSVYKCMSSDNVLEVSTYSLTKNIPFLGEPRENSFNYHLYYETQDGIPGSVTNGCRVTDGEQYLLNDLVRDMRKQKKQTFFDSGKCSAATSDSVLHPVNRNYKPNSSPSNLLHEASSQEQHGKSRVSHACFATTSHRKSSRQLWRKLKLAFAQKKFRWKRDVLDDNNRLVTPGSSSSLSMCRSYSTPCVWNVQNNNENVNGNLENEDSNRYSTTIIELYNLLNDLVQDNAVNQETDVFVEPKTTTNVCKETTTTLIRADFGCQVTVTSPDTVSMTDKRTKINNNRKSIQQFDLNYPGLGRIKLPSNHLRTSIFQLISDKGVANKLKFLEQITDGWDDRYGDYRYDDNDNDNNNQIRRSRSCTRSKSIRNDRHRDLRDETSRTGCVTNLNPELLRCSSESRTRLHRNLSTIESRTPRKMEGAISSNNHLFIIEENKSLSFSDLRPIPRDWGLTRDNEIIAMFEFPRRPSNEMKTVEYDDENSFRLGVENIDEVCGLSFLERNHKGGGGTKIIRIHFKTMKGIVNNAIAAIKIASENVSTTQQVAMMCDKFVRCKDSNRQSTSSLLLAVDSIIALISDGLCSDSIRNKKLPTTLATGIKMSQRLWMFIEESCRGTLVKDASQKLALSNLLKQVKQTCTGATSVVSRSKEWTIQLKLQIFIVLAIKTNLLHIWLKAVVANDTILHRFFNSSSFLRQARTTYSNALSAIVVEIRHLSVPGSSKISSIIGKPVSPRSRTMSGFNSGGSGGQSSNSSTTTATDSSSILKSRIPRSSRRSSSNIINKKVPA